MINRYFLEIRRKKFIDREYILNIQLISFYYNKATRLHLNVQALSSVNRTFEIKSLDILEYRKVVGPEIALITRNISQ